MNTVIVQTFSTTFYLRNICYIIGWGKYTITALCIEKYTTGVQKKVFNPTKQEIQISLRLIRLWEVGRVENFSALSCKRKMYHL